MVFLSLLHSVNNRIVPCVDMMRFKGFYHLFSIHDASNRTSSIFDT